MELQHFSHDDKLLLNEKNNLDPDEQISSLCFICSLPLFSTPYYSCSIGCNNFFIHKRCAHLPRLLKHVSEGDREAELVSQIHCRKCGRECNNVAWVVHGLRYTYGFLDAFCVAQLELRIFHGSHEHAMIPVHGDDTFVCGACGLKHEDQIRVSDDWGERIRLSIYYWCFCCGLRIHENCATLPNYIRHMDHHDHPLALTYALPRGDQYSYCCGICRNTITSLAIYFCGTCPYFAHIKCATHCSKRYKPVSSREVGELDYWFQFPMENEDRSLVTYILEKTRYPNNKESGQSSSSSISNIHEHELIFHNETSASLGRALCNGCIQPISPPYYSCSQCTDYLLHKSCANLPLSIEHPLHMEHDPLVLTTTHEISTFFCNGCWSRCNGFRYSCNECNFELDVQCAFLPKSIVHKAHDRRHVLHLKYDKMLRNSDCCGEEWIGRLSYDCTGCDFQIHGTCAGLPMWVRHKYDKHPLKLIIGPAPITYHQDNYFEEQKSDIIAATEQQQPYSDENFCEVCEKKINNKHWYYDCNECNNSFHVGCIPTVGRLSEIKLQATLNIPSHPHPLTGIRLLTDFSRNSKCGCCGKRIENSEHYLAFDCLECDFTVHFDCAYRDARAKH